MSDARTLYEQVILDHNKAPRNYGELPDADRVVDGVNPLCGDTFKVFVQFDGDTIKNLTFCGNGCAISKSSASLMTSILKGKSRQEALELIDAFQEMLKTDMGVPLDEAKLGKLRVFSGVREYPMRIKCATLAWHALRATLTGPEESRESMSVTTE